MNNKPADNLGQPVCTSLYKHRFTARGEIQKLRVGWTLGFGRGTYADDTRIVKAIEIERTGRIRLLPNAPDWRSRSRYSSNPKYEYVSQRRRRQ